MTEKWDRRFLQLAECVAGWSKDPSTKCGAVIVDRDKHIVSVGYNGFPSGMSDDESIYGDRELKYSRIIHAEMNALLHAGRLPEGCTVYTFPFFSCDRCAVHLLQGGVRTFVAPDLVGEETKARWDSKLTHAKQYIEECGGVVRIVER